MDNKTKKRRYKQISIADKMKIIKRLEQGEKNKILATEFGVSHSAITYIAQTKENVKEHYQLLAGQQMNQERTRLESIHDSLLEKVMYQWFCQKRSLGEPVSGPLIQEKARIFNDRLEGPSNFLASSGWISRFKHRHGIRGLCGPGGRLTLNAGATAEFREEFQQLLISQGYDLDNVYNADETCLAWKSLPRRTSPAIEESGAADRKLLKDRVTVMTCANATGSHQIKLLVIGKSQRPRCFVNVVNLPVTYRGQKNAWIDRKIFEEWYREEFLTAVTSKKGGEHEKFLLLLDSAPSHPPLAILNAIDRRCTVMYLPPHISPLIQPMEQGIIEATKSLYREAFLRNLLLVESRDTRSILEFLKGWTMRDCCRTIAEAWDSLTEGTLANAWKRMLSDSFESAHQDPVVEITSLLNDIQPGHKLYTDSETEEWLRIDESYPAWEVLSDEQIIAVASEQELPESCVDVNNEYDDNEDEGGSVVQEVPQPREIVAAINMLSQWYEYRWETEPQDFQSLRKMREIAVDEALAEAKKSSLRSGQGCSKKRKAIT